MATLVSTLDGLYVSTSPSTISTIVSDSRPMTGMHTRAKSRLEGFSCRYDSIALSSLTAAGSSLWQQPLQSQPSEREVSHVIACMSSSEHCWPSTSHDRLHAWLRAEAGPCMCMEDGSETKQKMAAAAMGIVAGAVTEKMIMRAISLGLGPMRVTACDDYPGFGERRTRRRGT